MLVWDATALAKAASGVRGACWLVDVNFSTGLQRVSSWSDDLTTTTGFTYTRLGAGLQVSKVSESADASPEKLVFSLSVADTAKLALAIGDATVYRGKKVTLYLQLMNEDGTVSGAPVRRWFGYVDSTSIERRVADPNSGGDKPAGGTIKLSCSKAGQSRSRRSDGLRITHEQHQTRFPGDNGYEYTVKLIEQPTQWLSKRFQEV